MTRARRLAALAAAGVAGLVCWLPSAPAATAQVDGDGWSVEWDDPVASTPSEAGAVVVSGTIDFPPARTLSRIEVVLTRVGGDERCAPEVTGVQEPRDDNDVAEGESTTVPTPTTEPPGPPEDESTFAFDVPLSFAAAHVCNGQYEIEATGFVDGLADAGSEWESDDVEGPAQAYDGRVLVDAPPPDVARVDSSFNAATRTVALMWQPPVGYGEGNACSATAASDHPDFAGYVVQRAVGESAAFATLPNGGVAAGSLCLLDQLPADAPLGQYRYRVLASRTGTAGPVVAAGGAASIATVVVGAAPPTTAPPTSAGTRPPAGAPTNVGGPAVAPAGTAPPAPDDGTFEETLDYPEVGEEAAVLPDDADTFLDFVPSPGEGILVPFAIAECLAVWAFHLRYLARRADEGF